MKPHLPKKLFIALCAAMTAVAATTQAAITMTDITQWSGYDEATGVAHVGNIDGTINNAKQQDDFKLVSPAHIWNAAGSASCTWDTVSEIWLLDDAPAMFTDGGDAKFTGDAAYKQVTIDSGVSAGKVTVSADYTFNTTGSGYVNSSKLTIADGATLTVNGEGTVSTQELVNKGTLSIGEGASVSVSGSTPVAGGETFATTGSGTLALTTFAVSGGTVARIFRKLSRITSKWMIL